MKHELVKLPYAYDALEPYLDAKTMELHHGKHHQAYVDNLNKALEHTPALQGLSVEQLLKELDKVPENLRAAVKNHGGGVCNHDLFWTLLKKDAGAPTGALAAAIEQKYGSFDAFKEEFTKASMGRFGSGWSWLVLNKGELEIYSTGNQDSPISEGKFPLLTLDVWEHAYYLKYQNKRAEYVANFFNIIDWREVEKKYDAAVKTR